MLAASAAALQRRHGLSRFAPVVIIGGGPVGTILSLLLSKLGVPSLLAEKAERGSGGDGALSTIGSVSGSGSGSAGGRAAPQALPHPRAHVLNYRTMEVLRQGGVSQRVYEEMPPAEEWRRWRYCSTLLGRDLCVIDHLDDGDGLFSNLEAASPETIANLKQPIVERALLEGATAAWMDSSFSDRFDISDGFLYGHECVRIEEHEEDGIVVAHLKSSGEDGETVKVGCRHLVAADGVAGVGRRSASISSQEVEHTSEGAVPDLSSFLPPGLVGGGGGGGRRSGRSSEVNVFSGGGHLGDASSGIEHFLS